MEWVGVDIGMQADGTGQDNKGVFTHTKTQKSKATFKN